VEFEEEQETGNTESVVKDQPINKDSKGATVKIKGRLIPHTISKLIRNFLNFGRIFGFVTGIF